ncbi:MAG: hypothetical protein JJU05_07920 [Verrucomicrobia bacterium]|nr:hypothetical protein [Verrucomicrobiota bacterium]
MNTLTLTFHQNLTRYFPGEPLRGAVNWNLEKEEKHLTVQLLWHTSGESVTNRSIVETLTWESPGRQGERAFEFTLPEAPHSFQGHLITLHWAVEVIARKNKLSEQLEFTLSPTGEPIQIPKIDPDPSESPSRSFLT